MQPKSKLITAFFYAFVIGCMANSSIAQNLPSNDPRMTMGPEVPDKIKATFNSGYTLAQAQDYRNAADKYQEVIRALPNFVPARLNYVICLKQLNRNNDAVWESEAAARILPDDSGVLLSLGNSYQLNGQRDKAIQSLERYLWLYPNEKNSSAIRTAVESMKQENQKSSVFADSRGKDNYLDECLTETVSRWRIAQMPVTVYIFPGEGISGYIAPFRQMITSSFEEWQRAANDRISFKFVDSPDKALITVKWTAKKSDMQTQIEAGETLTDSVVGRMNSAKILLLTLDDRGFSPSNMKGTCLHEIGHALGLTGHSSDPNDVMFMFTKKTVLETLSTRDKKTLLRLYTLSADEMDKFASYSNQGAGIKLGKTEQAAGEYNDDGAKKFGAGKYLEATKLFEQALAINPTSSMIQLNAGKAYFKLGMQEFKDDNFIKAQRHLELSAKYFKQTKNGELAAAAYQNLMYLARLAKNETDAKMYQAEAAKAWKAPPKAPAKTPPSK